MATICGAFSRKVVQASVAVIVLAYSTAAGLRDRPGRREAAIA
jgi:hypothetical protein